MTALDVSCCKTAGGQSDHPVGHPPQTTGWTGRNTVGRPAVCIKLGNSVVHRKEHLSSVYAVEAFEKSSFTITWSGGKASRYLFLLLLFYYYYYYFHRGRYIFAFVGFSVSGITQKVVDEFWWIFWRGGMCGQILLVIWFRCRSTNFKGFFLQLRDNLRAMYEFC